MRAWMLIIGLGCVALLSGGVLLFQQHHTLSLGGLGLGIMLIMVGAALGFRERKGGGTKTAREPTTRPGGGLLRRGLLRTLVAVLVVIAVGVGTFYGTTAFVPHQTPGSPTTGVIISGSQTSSGGYTSVTNTGSTSAHVSTFTQTTEISTTSLTTSVGSQTSSTSSSQTTTSTSSNATSYPFVLLPTPEVIVQGSDATLKAQYTNQGASAIQANVQVLVQLPDGTIVGTGSVYYPSGPTVSPAGNLTVDYNMGSFPSGSYTVTLYVVDQSQSNQVSASTTLVFST